MMKYKFYFNEEINLQNYKHDDSVDLDEVD